MKLTGNTITNKEIAYVLMGERRGSIILAKMNWRSRGTEASVLFDGERVLAREESHGDVVGFYHSHPPGFTEPSVRDDKTMSAWSFCFGKPLLCVIATERGLRAWVYGAGTADLGAGTVAGAQARIEVKHVELFSKRFLVACLDLLER